jgi:hypothetical protein
MLRRISVSNSILRRREELGDAIWTWLWLVDRTTQFTVMSRGGLEGLVADGDKVEPATIAKDLGLPVKTVNKHVTVLCRAGLLSKMGSQIPESFATPARGAR